MIAHRYLPAVCVLFACALVPTLIHSYSDALPHDGRTAAAIPTLLAGYTSTPTSRNATWGKRRFDSDDWIDRNYSKGSRRVRLTVVRSYDPKSLYHHPELAIDDSTAFSGVETQHDPARPDMPIHVLAPAAGVNAAAAYVLHYGDRFVDNPIVFQLLTAGELLVTKRQAMTIFFALERGSSEVGSPLAPPVDLLLAAVDDFLGQTLETGSATE